MKDIINSLAKERTCVKVDFNKLDEFIKEFNLFGFLVNGDIWMKDDFVYVYLKDRKIKTLPYTVISNDDVFSEYKVYSLWQNENGYFLRQV